MELPYKKPTTPYPMPSPSPTPSPEPEPEKPTLPGDIPYELDKDGLVTATPSADDFKGSELVLDISAIAEATALEFLVDPAWFTESGLTLTLIMPGGNEVVLNDSMMKFIARLQEGGMVLFRIELGSLLLSVSQDGVELPWYNYENPIIIRLRGENPMISDKSTGDIFARSWNNGGTVSVKVYETGYFDTSAGKDAAFTDTEGKWMNDAVSYCAARGVIEGTGGGLFTPDQEVTRAEFITMLMRLLDIDLSKTELEIPPAWNDEAEIPGFAKVHVQTASALGIITGDDKGNFNPHSRITRQDMFTMLYRAMDAVKLLPEETDSRWMEYSDWDDVSGYAQAAVQELSKLGLVEGVGGNAVNPLGSSKRSEAAQIMYKLLRYDAAFY